MRNRADEALVILQQGLSELGDSARDEEIVALCNPALEQHALEEASEAQAFCGEAYLRLGNSALEAKEEQGARHFLARAQAAGADRSETSKLNLGIKSLVREQEAEAEANAYLAQVEREIAGLDNFDVSTYTASKETITIGLALFSVWADLARKASHHKLSPSQKKRVEVYRNKVRRVQANSLPRLRDAYGPVLRKSLWQFDMEASTYGAGYRTIEFVGGVFAANRNIEEFHGQMRETLHQLRFKEARYKWYKGADRFTYYKLDSPPDTELVVLH